MSKLRVLLLAESANPKWTSVPLVAWSQSRAIAELVDAHLVTQIRNRSAILSSGWREGKEFTAIDSERIAKPMYRISEFLRGDPQKGYTTLRALSVLSEYYFDHLVWHEFGHRIKSGEFDIVHRLVPVSPTIPSFMAGRCRRAGVPFVWGPINGGIPWPKGFRSVQLKEREWLAYVRGAYKLLPGYRAIRRDAAAIIIGSKDTWQQMPERYIHKCIYVPENGVDPDRFSTAVSRYPEPPLRLAFVGRLVALKGVDMLIEATAPLIRNGRVVLDIIGDGPEMSRLRDLVGRENVADGVRFAGWVDNKELPSRLVQSDVFGFPSIHDFGGAVVLEAMALGLVPVVINYGGPGELVNDDVGYRIPMGSRIHIIKGLRETLSHLAAEPSVLLKKRDQARQRVRQFFTWPAKAEQIMEVYKWVLGVRPDKPDFKLGVI
jgi:glycosyltransferase involved in cell wall biosynthesis